MSRHRLETLPPALSSTTGLKPCRTEYSQNEAHQDAPRHAAFIKECDACPRKVELKELATSASTNNENLTAARQDVQAVRARCAELESYLKRQQAPSPTASGRAARSELNEKLEGDFARPLAYLTIASSGQCARQASGFSRLTSYFPPEATPPMDAPGLIAFLPLEDSLKLQTLPATV